MHYLSEYVISAGNISDGFKFIGPFKAYENALAHIQDHGLNDWNIITLQNPQAKHHHKAA